MSEKHAFEKVYEKPDSAIWTLEEPPQILRDLVEDGTIRPCKTLDIACGEGTTAVYLAKKGFEITGIDFVENAIEYARVRAKKTGAKVEFKVMDATNLSDLKEKFDFIFEWALIHHLKSEQVAPYLKQIPKLLNPGGLYLTNSFNIKSPLYGQPGVRIRKTFLGTELLYHSQEEMRDLLSEDFEIIKEAIVPLVGKGVQQIGNFFLVRKK